MRLAHVMSTTRIVSSKSDLLHVHDSRTQHEKCRILNHVLIPYDRRSHNKNVRMTSCILKDLFLTQAARATKVAYDSRKQKLCKLALIGPKAAATRAIFCLRW